MYDKLLLLLLLLSNTFTGRALCTARRRRRYPTPRVWFERRGTPTARYRITHHQADLSITRIRLNSTCVCSFSSREIRAAAVHNRYIPYHSRVVAEHYPSRREIIIINNNQGSSGVVTVKKYYLLFFSALIYYACLKTPGLAEYNFLTATSKHVG